MQQHIILDRDGVINQDSDQFIKSCDEWIPIPGSLEAITRLRQAGFSVAIATNQSGIARGLLDQLTLDSIHQKMYRALAKLGTHIDFIAYCPHGPDDDCSCRKPKPGLYVAIGQRWKQDLQGIPIIGDSRRDLEAAVAIGARPILVRTGKGQRTENNLQGLGKIDVFDDLAQAVDALLLNAA